MYHSAGLPSKKSNPNNPRGFGYYISRTILGLLLLVPAAVFSIDGVDSLSLHELFSYQWFDAVAKIAVGIVFALLVGLVVASVAKRNVHTYLIASILAIIWLLANAFVIYGLVMPDVVLGTFENGTKRGLADGNTIIFYVVLALILLIVDVLPLGLVKKSFASKSQRKK